MTFRTPAAAHASQRFNAPPTFSRQYRAGSYIAAPTKDSAAMCITPTDRCSASAALMLELSIRSPLTSGPHFTASDQPVDKLSNTTGYIGSHVRAKALQACEPM
jgi:hypothetical protein